MTMVANNQRTVPGISSALDVPVAHRSKEGESTLFRGVVKRNGTPVLMDGAAFCSRVEFTTVVIRVSTSRLFGLFGSFGLFG
jgi:hypothetical protein